MADVPLDLERERWHLGSELALWVFNLPRLPSETVQLGLKRHTLSVLSLVSFFARVKRIEWITESAGEDAAKLIPNRDPDHERVVSIFERLSDVVEMSMCLDLHCVSSTGVEFVLGQGAHLYLTVCAGEDNVSLQVELSLDADIYSPRTVGRQPANETLASLNNPRLASFLRGVRERMGGRVFTIVAPSYEDLVNEDGFVVSEAR